MKRVGTMAEPHKHPAAYLLRRWLRERPGWHAESELRDVVRAAMRRAAEQSVARAEQLVRELPAEPSTAALRRLESPRRRRLREAGMQAAPRNRALAAAEVDMVQIEQRWDLITREALQALRAQGCAGVDGMGRWRYVPR